MTGAVLLTIKVSWGGQCNNISGMNNVSGINNVSAISNSLAVGEIRRQISDGSIPGLNTSGYGSNYHPVDTADLLSATRGPHDVVKQQQLHQQHFPMSGSQLGGSPKTTLKPLFGGATTGGVGHIAVGNNISAIKNHAKDCSRKS